jgi:hypothetical protein
VDVAVMEVERSKAAAASNSMAQLCSRGHLQKPWVLA